MKTTEQKNRLIAEFMGVNKNNNGTYELPQFGRLNLGGEFKTEFNNTQLKYHTSWDWLMPVIGEVKYSAGESDEITDVLDRIDSGLLGRNIEYTFNSVVEFIEWYNENK